MIRLRDFEGVEVGKTYGGLTFFGFAKQGLKFEEDLQKNVVLILKMINDE